MARRRIPSALHLPEGALLTVFGIHTPQAGTHHAGGRRGALALALLPGTAFMVLFIIRSAAQNSSWRFTLFDDALISFAYGRTLAQTGEWVWFPGADRVQGITNPLWSAIMAVVHLPSPSPQVAMAAMSVVGLIVVLGCAVIVHRIVLDAGGSNSLALIGAAFVPFLYPLVFWTVRGMEVGLIALLLLLVMWSLLRVSQQTGAYSRMWMALATICGALAVWTRLDALVLIGAIVLASWLSGNRSVRRAALLLAAVSLLAALLLLVFQGLYWGDYLPNTYRLKVDGIPLSDRLERGFFATARALPLLVVSTIAWLRLRNGDCRTSSALVAAISLAVTVVALTYSVWTGGDAWEWSLMLNRTVSAVLPVALAAWLLAFSTTSRPIRPGLIAALAVSGIGLGFTVNPTLFSFRLAAIGVGLSCVAAAFVMWLRRPTTRERLRALVLASAFFFATSAPGAILWVQFGGLNVAEDARFAARAEELREVTDPSAVIAVMWAGAPGYVTDRPLIDMFGKSDRVIATGPPAIDPQTGAAYPFIPGHNKWDYEYSIHLLRPDVVFQLGDDRGSVEGRILEWGYERRCLSDGWISYFRTDSPSVRWDELSSC